MTSRLNGYVVRVMQGARELTHRPPAPWQVHAQIEIEKTRAHVAATRRFLDEMRVGVRGRQRRRAQPRLGA